MSEHELEVLRLKNMLPEGHRPIQRLHPTIKGCRCGFIGTKTQLYNHLGEWTKHYKTSKEFFAEHSEVPINENDPKVQQSASIATLLEESVKQSEAKKRKDLIDSI